MDCCTKIFCRFFSRLDSSRISSKENLKDIMVVVANRCGLSVSKYTCYASVKSGPSCVALLEQGHISLRSWPSIGDVSLDILLVDDRDMLEPLVSMLETYFDELRHPTNRKSRYSLPSVEWSLRERRFTGEAQTSFSDFHGHWSKVRIGQRCGVSFSATFLFNFSESFPYMTCILFCFVLPLLGDFNRK